jgi:hypothetical protein
MRPGEKKFTTMMEPDPVNQMGSVTVKTVICPNKHCRKPVDYPDGFTGRLVCPHCHGGIILIYVEDI